MAPPDPSARRCSRRNYQGASGRDFGVWPESPAGFEDEAISPDDVGGVYVRVRLIAAKGREVYEARGLASQPREVFPRIDSSCWRVAAPGPARETLAGLRRIKKVGDAPGALSVGRDGRENCSVAAAPTFPAGLP